MEDETTKTLAKIMPENSLDYFIEKRSGKKRNYVFDYGKSKVCDHPTLQIIARGGIVYRCTKCNYAFHIIGGYQQPLHNEVIQSAFNLLVFSKEFGMNSLGEVLRRPIGQHDSSPHKPVLPEGMSFVDVLKLLENVDVNAGDGGAAQIYKLLDEVWVAPKERALQEAKEERLRQKLALLVGQTKRKELCAGDNGEGKPGIKSRKKRASKSTVSRMSAS